MSHMRKCDRCKKSFEPSETYLDHTNTYHGIIFYVCDRYGDHIGELQRYGLCNECNESLMSWMFSMTEDVKKEVNK